jgi:hypothetical protein
MDRTPPISVRRALRQQVGFGCPVPDCDNPYLTYHHFDPPWHVQAHHSPEGMIALCATHHAQADAGAFTDGQLRAMKHDAVSRPIRGRFNWMRDRLLAVVGGNFYYETLTILTFRGEKSIWFNRDSDDRLLLNIRMLTSSGAPRLRLEDNDWLVLGNPLDFESPPSGKRIYAKYDNGDDLRVEFRELPDEESAIALYPTLHPAVTAHVQFPIVAVEVQETIGGTPYCFSPNDTCLPGIQVTGCFSSHVQTALNL